jgi:hypothetical protein
MELERGCVRGTSRSAWNQESAMNQEGHLRMLFRVVAVW